MSQKCISEEEAKQVLDLYLNTDLTQDEIAEKVGVTRKQVWRVANKNCTPEFMRDRKRPCYARSKTGDKNPQFGKKYSLPTVKNYSRHHIPEWYTGHSKDAHVILMCKELGITELPKGFVVHHCDFNRVNNTIDNLVLMTRREHQALHMHLRDRVNGSATTMSKDSTIKWLEARRAAQAAKI
jgi:hypothetical protein